MKTIQIREYGTFIVGEKNGSNVGGNITLTKRTFEQLENFILSNSSKETDALDSARLCSWFSGAVGYGILCL